MSTKKRAIHGRVRGDAPAKNVEIEILKKWFLSFFRDNYIIVQKIPNNCMCLDVFQIQCREFDQNTWTTFESAPNLYSPIPAEPAARNIPKMTFPRMETLIPHPFRPGYIALSSIGTRIRRIKISQRHGHAAGIINPPYSALRWRPCRINVL